MASLTNGRFVDGLSGSAISALKSASVAKQGAEGKTKTLSSAKSFSDATGYVMDLIYTDNLNLEQQKTVMKETMHAWNEHINPGFLQYRKSVADDFAAIEWRDGAPGGSVVMDAAGNEYIDCLGGFGIYNVGHSHPVVVKAVQKQMTKQSLHSQELLDPLRAYCADLLVRTLPGDLKYAFFTNSGTESVEACLKMAMLSTGRKHFVGVVGAFHGKSLGSLSATSKAVFRRAFGGGLLSFSHVPVNDCEALKRVFESSSFTGNDIAGFIVEPILGEGGIHVCSDEFLRTARELCDQHGSMLIFDEVQSGMGRSGKFWACEHAGVAPDLMAIGKAFGGGVAPAGACVGTERAWRKYFENPFLHTTTFGGCPLAMAASIACMHVLETENLIEAAAVKGVWLKERLDELAEAHPHIMKVVRGRGLMIGMEFQSDEIGYRFAKGAFSHRIVISGTLVNSRVLRVEPPLTITQLEMEQVIERFSLTLAEMEAELFPEGDAEATQSPADVVTGGEAVDLLPTIPEDDAPVKSDAVQAKPARMLTPHTELAACDGGSDGESDPSDSEGESIATSRTTTSSVNPKPVAAGSRRSSRLLSPTKSHRSSSGARSAVLLTRLRADSRDTAATLPKGESDSEAPSDSEADSMLSSPLNSDAESVDEPRLVQSSGRLARKAHAVAGAGAQ